MARPRKSPIELASDIGSKAFDLYAYGDVSARHVLAVIAHVNPEILAWLRDQLLQVTVEDTDGRAPSDRTEQESTT